MRSAAWKIDLGRASEDVVARCHAGPMHHVRGTLLCASIAGLRAQGLFEDYRRLLAPASAELLLSAISASWIPVALGCEHYAACDRLGLGRERILQMGAASGQRLEQTVFNTFAMLAQQVGVDPWTVFGTWPRVWSRQFDGGGLRVQKQGPKDAQVELLDLPFARFAYFRTAMCGLTHTVLGKFARTVYVREAALPDGGFAMKISWV